MTNLPARHIDILHKVAFAHFATIMTDGSPQVSPVWVDEHYKIEPTSASTMG